MDGRRRLPWPRPRNVHAGTRRHPQNPGRQTALPTMPSHPTMPRLRPRTRPTIRHLRNLRRPHPPRTRQTFTQQPDQPKTPNMTNPQKRKGDHAERELAKLLTDLLGFRVRRKLGAGRADDTGDLDGLPDCTAQAKNYADTMRAINQGLKDLPLQQANSGDKHAVLFVRRRGGQWIAVMSVEQWATTYRETL